MSRRTTAATGLAVAAALFLAACGGSSDPGTGAEEPQQAGAEFPRTVVHAMGETEIPAQPERVVVLDTGELDSVLSLGVTPVGAVTTAVSDEFLSYLADDAEGVEVVGTIAEPNLEAIAALSPDLILSNTVRHEDIYDQLAQIAPTVFGADVGDTWKENYTLAAEALGMEEEAAAALEEYEADAAALGEAIGDPAGTTVSAVRFVGGVIRVYRPQSFIGTVLADIGLDQLELTTGENATFAEVSAEEITQVDADIVLYSSYGPPDDSGEAAVLAGPLWSRIPAVADGRAYAVEDDVFFTGIGLMAANLMIEDLADQLG